MTPISQLKTRTRREKSLLTQEANHLLFPPAALISSFVSVLLSVFKL